MALTATVVVKGQSGNHQHSWCGAFAEGLRRHGWRADVSSDPKPADLLVRWGVRDQRMIRARGGEVCILERGYIGDRFAWTSVSFGGGLNGRAEFRGEPIAGRFAVHGKMADWSDRDGYVLLIGQVDGDMSLAGIGGKLDGWLAQSAAEIVRTGRKAVYRPHPLAKGIRPVTGAETRSGPLSRALADASLVVTFNSNTAVDAVLAGVPAVTMDKGSMAWPVTTHAIAADPIRPDRTAWADALASRQWSMDEIRSGACWAHINGL